MDTSKAIALLDFFRPTLGTEIAELVMQKCRTVQEAKEAIFAASSVISAIETIGNGGVWKPSEGEPQATAAA